MITPFLLWRSRNLVWKNKIMFFLLSLILTVEKFSRDFLIVNDISVLRKMITIGGELVEISTFIQHHRKRKFFDIDFKRDSLEIKRIFESFWNLIMQIEIGVHIWKTENVVISDQTGSTIGTNCSAHPSMPKSEFQIRNLFSSWISSNKRLFTDHPVLLWVSTWT